MLEAEHGDLNGSRALDKREEPVAGGVVVEVDEYVDRIGCDPAREMIVVKSCAFAPVVCNAA